MITVGDENRPPPGCELPEAVSSVMLCEILQNLPCPIGDCVLSRVIPGCLCRCDTLESMTSFKPSFQTFLTAGFSLSKMVVEAEVVDPVG